MWERERWLALLDALFSDAPVGLAFWDAELRFVRVNETLAEINGAPVAAHLGRTVSEMLPRLGPQLTERFRTILETGVPLRDAEIVGETPAAPGIDRVWRASYFPVRDASGATIGLAAVVIEITEQRRAERAQRFLADAGRQLVATLDYAATLETIANLAVPMLADWASVDLVESAAGRVENVALAHADPGDAEVAAEIRRRYPDDPAAGGAVHRVIRTGQAELHGEVSGDLLREAAGDDEELALLRSLGMRSAIVAPMRAHGETLGALTLIATRPGRRFTERELELAATLADRCGLAVGNARLHREREEAAHTLERTLLPTSLPDIAGVDLGVRYRPAEGEVGGDFYDVFPHGDGYLALVGDVGGKGVGAAAVTGIARHTARAAAYYEADPIGVLNALNRALLGQPEGDICTATCVRIRNSGGAIQLAVTSAGPPLPLRLTAAGKVEEVGTHGTLLGAFPDIELSQHQLTLRPGEMIVLFSDGIPEARVEGQFFGEERIEQLIADSRGLSAAETAQRLEEAAVAFQRGNPRDDIAIAVLRATG